MTTLAGPAFFKPQTLRRFLGKPLAEFHRAGRKRQGWRRVLSSDDPRTTRMTADAQPGLRAPGG